ncbi:MAG TPA: DUF1326 domain-containing protein [Terriglobales bacterium]|jgi:hypothetical protein|nr:DUF1326 domain-containing protein [Terriglobales bacterium]
MQHGLRTVVLIALLALSTTAFGQQIRGDYIETRSADVYTGQCFANGEVNLVGDEAILAWHVESGGWDGVALDGLTVAAAVHANATLGDPYANPYPARAVLLVDDQATPQQSSALIAFAHQMGGELLRHAQRVISVPMELAVNPERHGVALLRAGQFATVQTRPVNGKDHVCGNEVTFYPPLTQLTHSMPAVALTDSYRGPGLDVDWESHGRRSAFVGTFVR